MFWDLKKIIEKLKKMTSEFKTRKGCSQKRENPASTIQCQQLLAPYKARITLKKSHGREGFTSPYRRIQTNQSNLTSTTVSVIKSWQN